MKPAVIILALLCVVLGYVVYKQGSSTNTDIDTLTKERTTLSNEVWTATNRLVSVEATSSTMRSNLQHLVEKRTSDLNVLSNRLVQTHLLFQNAQKEAHHAGEQLQAKVARIAVLEVEIESLKRSAVAAANDPSAREAESYKQKLAAMTKERDALRTQVGVMQVEQAEMQSKLFDIEFLDRQRKDAEEAADIRRRMVSNRTGTPPSKAKLELQPDGTVRYYIPPMETNR